MIHEKIDLYSREGEKLRTDLRYDKNGKKKPVIVFLHGFKGFKDWGPFPAFNDRLAASGFVSVAFNFSHNGVGDDLLNFTELDRFSLNTFTRELQEAEDVIHSIESGALPIESSEIDTETIGIIGHSRGGGIAILAARRMRAVRAIVALASVSSFDRYTPRQREKWRREGVFQVLNTRTGQVMRLSTALLDDLEMHREQLDILKSAEETARLEKPFYVIAGEQDLTAPVKESQAIATAAKGPYTQFEVVPKASHTFGAAHPFTGITPQLEEVMGKTIGFLQQNLILHPMHSAL